MAAADYEAWYQPPKGDNEIAKLTDVANGDQEGVVDDVLGLVTTDQRDGGRQQRRTMAVQYGAERGRVAPGGAADQFGVACLHVLSVPPARA